MAESPRLIVPVHGTFYAVLAPITEPLIRAAAGLSLVAHGAPEEIRAFDAGLSDGSHHPDWFGAVAQKFVDAVRGADDGANLLEARICLAIETAARESSRRGGERLAIAPAG